MVELVDTVDSKSALSRYRFESDNEYSIFLKNQNAAVLFSLFSMNNKIFLINDSQKGVATLR